MKQKQMKIEMKLTQMMLLLELLLLLLSRGLLLFLELACVSTILHCLISRASHSFYLFCESSAVQSHTTGHIFL